MKVMYSPLIKIEAFKDTIKSDGLVLTANSRQSNAINTAFALTQDEDSAWLAPKIYSLEQWTKRLWNELQDQAHPSALLSVVSQFEDTYFWNRAIESYEPEVQDRYVSLAAQTLKLLKQQMVTLADIPESTPATEKLGRWVSEYDALLARNDLITKERCIEILIEAFDGGALNLEQSIQTFGWQTMPPLHKKLINAASKNTILNTENRISSPSTTLLAKADDEADELRAATLWAVTCAKENPNARIAIVIPSLDDQVTQIERLMSEAIREVNKDTEAWASVNFSAGHPLGTTPIVATALNILDLLSSHKSMESVIELVNNPFIALSHLSISQKATLELDLRKTRAFECPLDLLVNHLPASDQIQGFKTVLKKQNEIIKVQQSFSAWCDTFVEILNLTKWGPAGISLSSMEYQQVTVFGGALEEFSALDSLGITVGYKKALRHLKEILSKTIFHAETVDGQIQVLGLLEAVGLNVDFAWVTSMESKKFPSQTSINELLPATFQRNNEFPFSLPENELAVATKMVDTLKSSTKETLIFSYPSKNKDEDILPSPLLSNLGTTTTKDIINPTEMPPWFIEENLCELITDNGCEFNPELENISTGATLLKNQSGCPFNAFAIHRLKAQPLEQPSIGLLPMDRGNLLHSVMESLLTEIKDSTTLHAYSEGELRNVTSVCIAKHIKAWRAKHPAFAGPTFRELEQARLEKLVGQWLEIEKSRGEFTVKSLETKQTIQLGSLSISMIIDRVDAVGDDELVIDYKSGVVHPSHWEGERPKDPQLPLYVIAGSPEVTGCAFAQIKGGDLKFVGLSQQTAAIDPKSGVEDWPLQVDQWKASLAGLAIEFANGGASMNITNQTLFTQQDWLQPLSRHAERNIIQQAFDTQGDA